MNQPAIQVIEALGGTAAVARIFNLSMPSVSDWKKDGIPEARVMFLKVAHRKALAGLDLVAATSSRSGKSVPAAQPQQPAQGGEVAHG
jgi:hypothetical protein